MEQILQLLSRRSIVPHVLLPVTQLLALSLPPFRARSPIFVALIAALGFLSYLNMVTDDIATRLALVNQWWIFLGTIEKLLFSNVEEDYHQVGRKRREAALMPFGLEKFKWALSLLLSPRGIGWNFQVKGVPVVAEKSLLRTSTKWQFLRLQILRYIKYFVITDLIHVYATRNMYGTGIEPEMLTVRASTWSRSFLNALFAGLKIYFPLQLAYTMGSIISVHVGMYDPQDWPPLFGKLKDVTTVRWFWGNFWHQMMRKMFTGYGQAIVRILRIPRGTNLSSYTQLYVSFAISGLFHALMTYNIIPSTSSLSFEDSFMLAFKFFVLQAMGIHFEDTVLAAYRRLRHMPASKNQTFGRVFGYLWVISWFWFSLGWGGDALLKSGIMGVNDVPMPIAGKLLSKFNI